jgi:hypothetical protein
MGNRDGRTSRAEASVLNYQRIRKRAGRGSSKCERYREGRFQKVDEMQRCCQINYPVQRGTKGTCGIYGR